jgi:hypothetical protein
MAKGFWPNTEPPVAVTPMMLHTTRPRNMARRKCPHGTNSNFPRMHFEENTSCSDCQEPIDPERGSGGKDHSHRIGKPSSSAGWRKTSSALAGSRWSRAAGRPPSKANNWSSLIGSKVLTLGEVRTHARAAAEDLTSPGPPGCVVTTTPVRSGRE